jgi:hypothetical protein
MKKILNIFKAKKPEVVSIQQLKSENKEDLGLKLVDAIKEGKIVEI